ncbi:MAG: polyribonucleotide nucleotidyltransferase [Candidatus Paceibacterota bacterium]
MHSKKFTTEVGGRELTAEFSDLAEQAHGSVILRYGETIVLATAVMSENKKEGLDYFPLSVEYEEKFYAAGAILGSRFVRREGRPTDEAVLSGRVVDRTIRPLFDHTIRNEVQVVITVLSLGEDDPDILAVNAASLALLTSDIPWNGPVSAVRLGKKEGGDEFKINPSYEYRNSENLLLDLTACGKDGNINMIEVAADEIGEKELADSFQKASEEIEKLQTFQKQIAQEIGKEKRVIETGDTPKEATDIFESSIKEKMLDAIFSGAGKGGINALKKVYLKFVKENVPEHTSAAGHFFEEKVDELIHKEAIENERRADGRKMNEIRPLFAQAGAFSPILHGSGVFYRGGTHVFSALTLGGPGDSQLIDSMEEQETQKHFMHHYNFPPFSVGETGRVGGFNRRMIGHGALAEKALEPVIPKREDFPYTIRIVSESMASNGSTSMASTCASTLALMDAGVPIKRPVAGIALGLMMEPSEKVQGSAPRYKILTDIQGPEDHHGDMDFKVAGTSEGVTAIQMDVKVNGIPIKILSEALEQAKDARLQILEVLQQAIPEPRKEISPRAPEIVTAKVLTDQIGLVIGPGGKTINGIKEKTGVEDINIEDDGSIFITGRNGTAHVAKKMIEELMHEYVAGEKFTGVVTRVTDFGAFVRVGPNAEGLVHISEIAPFRINKVSDALSLGEEVPVVIKEIDEKKRINLSIKDIDPDFAKKKGLSDNTTNGREEEHTHS